MSADKNTYLNEYLPKRRDYSFKHNCFIFHADIKEVKHKSLRPLFFFFA